MNDFNRLNTAADTIRLADACIARETKERPETIWLKEQYLHFMRNCGAGSKEETDRMIFYRMYGRHPKTSQESLKLRYWRTGHHFPVSHEQCRAYGNAMEFNEEELLFLLQGYYDGCDRIYETAQPEDCVYRIRKDLIDSLVNAYLSHVSEEKMRCLKIDPRQLTHYLRHLYYTDALYYIHPARDLTGTFLNKHITSVNYDSELNRNLRLIGVIPRKTMMRHLLILGMPNVSLESFNRQLTTLGYLPLTEDHTLRSGERLDWLLIQFLRAFDAQKDAMSEAECIHWAADRLCILHEYFTKQGKSGLRFLYFKALKEWC